MILEVNRALTAQSSIEYFDSNSFYRINLIVICGTAINDFGPNKYNIDAYQMLVQFIHTTVSTIIVSLPFKFHSSVLHGFIEICIYPIPLLHGAMVFASNAEGVPISMHIKQENL